MSKHYSPLRYPGGKNRIFPFVSKLFYENGLLGTAYAEPYAGGAGLALRLLFDEYVSRIYINDLDRSIYAFWVSILNRTEDFCAWINDVPVNTDAWHKYKMIQNNARNEELFELAKSTFFLNRTNVSGVIKGGIIGGYEQLGRYKMDARFKKVDLIKRIQKVASLKDRISVSNYDGLDFVKKINKKKESIFVYLDPPYYQKGSDLYMNFYSKIDHERLSRSVRNMKKKWMISYDKHEFILNLYSQRMRVLYRLGQSTSNRVGDEVVIFSDDIKFGDSINHLTSPYCLLPSM